MKILSWVTRLMARLFGQQSKVASPPLRLFTAHDAERLSARMAARASERTATSVQGQMDTNDPYEIHESIRPHLLFTDQTVTMDAEIFHLLHNVKDTTHPYYARSIPWRSTYEDVRTLEREHYMHWYQLDRSKGVITRQTRRIVIGDWRALAGIK